MKRVKRITAKDYFGDVEISVKVSNTQGLTKRKVDATVTSLADSAMHAINTATYFKVPLSKIKVW